MNSNEALIKSLEREGVLQSTKTKEALLRFPREDFVPSDQIAYAYEDRALPIGEAQTISQPFTVMFMLKLLDAEEGDKVLEIGAGSGWQTSILSHLVGGQGNVWAYEINEDVGKFGKNNLEKFSLKNVEYVIDDACCHWERHSEYDKIISGAAFNEIPKDLKNLLKLGGRLVAPTQEYDVRVIQRLNKNHFKEEVYKGFAFVPIVH
jgi:protein-L-isoaspartate(D-aspartate) O-methyltransferase